MLPERRSTEATEVLTVPQHGKRRNQPPTPDFEAWLVQAKKNHPLMTADEEILKGRDVKAMNEVLLELEQQGKTKAA